MANGLINLQTDLKSLSYGSDKPYVTKNIGDAPSSGLSMQIERRVDDLSRITQMMIDKPGLRFLENQALIRQTDLLKKLSKAQNKGQFALQQVKDTVIGTAKTALSILAQVPVNGTGTHFVEGFRTDTYIRPAGDSGAFREFFGAGGVEGAQYALRGEEVPTGPTSIDQNKSRIGNPSLGFVSSKYSTDADTTAESYGRGFEGQQPIVSRWDEESTYLQSKVDDRTLNQNVTREKRVLLGDQGARKGISKKLNQYWFASSPVDIAKRKFADETDKINALDIQSTKVQGETEGRDLIKFRFHVVTPEHTRILYFRAFLDSFNDTFTGTWNQVKYLGRAEDMQIYSGFQRKISLSFKIAAATRAEMKPLYRKMLYLASATAPTYGQSGQFMRGTITKLTVGDYAYELPGVLNNVTFTWQQDYPWEIAMKEPEYIDADGKTTPADKTMQELPMVLDCQIDFTPIHTFTPETGLKQYFTTGTENAPQEGDGGKDELGKGFFINDTALGGDPLANEKAKASSDDSSKGLETQAITSGEPTLDQQLSEVSELNTSLGLDDNVPSPNRIRRATPGFEEGFGQNI